MANNHSSLNSSSAERPPSAFQWPIPSSSSDITIKEILDSYQHDPEILKLVLIAKAEEDKKQTAQSTLQIERTRIQQRMMDMDALRSYPQPPPGAVIYPSSSSSSSQQAQSSQQQQQQQQLSHNQYQQPPQQQHHNNDNSNNHSNKHSNNNNNNNDNTHQHQPTSYHSLPSFQQQVIARVTSDHQHHQPVSPAGYYPHSAHPLCPPSSHHEQNKQQHNSKSQHTPQPQTTITTRPSYYYDHEQKNGVGKKRPHDAKLSHDQVMEVLKAKLQRGNNAVEKNKRARTLPSPLVTTATNATTTTTSTTASNNNNNTQTTGKPALPPPPPHHPHHNHNHHSQPPLSTPSPRSAKPVLPPIDTSVGRIPSRGPLSSNSSQKLPPFSATAALADASVIKGERRVKSLSPPPFATSTHRSS